MLSFCSICLDFFWVNSLSGSDERNSVHTQQINNLYEISKEESINTHTQKQNVFVLKLIITDINKICDNGKL